ncbi:hypothetical protein J0J19_23345, partial [Vibrio vulnificus]|uniref:hypothetical protein n=1 Tax=Vibrio vulnificus TaxID=672 RepID=UPI0019D46657
RDEAAEPSPSSHLADVTSDCNTDVIGQNVVDEVIVPDYVINDDIFSKIMGDFAYIGDLYCDDSSNMASELTSAFHID